MKHTIQLFLFLFFMSTAIKAQTITYLFIIPANPTETDTIFLVSYTNFHQTHNNMLDYIVDFTDSNINVSAWHELGDWDGAGPKAHTMMLGKLIPGDYELNYQVSSNFVDVAEVFVEASDTLTFTVQSSPVEINDSTITEQNITLSLTQGWNMIGYTCQEQLNVIEAFSSVEDKIIIVKDNVGNAYLPEFGYNGIGDLEFAKGYQLKITEDINDLYFCPTLIQSE